MATTRDSSGIANAVMNARVGHNQRWLILTQYYSPEVGSPQVRLSHLARELSKHGISVSVLTAFPNYPTGRIFRGYRGMLWKHETVAKIPVTRTWLYASSDHSAARRIATYLSFTTTSFLAAVTRRNIDVIFVEAQPLSLGLTAFLMKRLRGIPYIYHVPDLQVDVAEELGFLKGRRHLTTLRRCEEFFMRHAWKISTPTLGFIQHIHRRGIPRDSITFLPNGADPEQLRPQPPALDLLDRWNLHRKKV